jgi:type IV pilus assembly protein PilM
MKSLTALVEKLRGLDPERMAGLRPACPPVAVEMDHTDIVLVRLRRSRRGRASLEAHQVRPMPDPAAASILRPNLAAPEEVTRRVRQLFEASGTRPGRVSLVLPDNLAKISLISLPEKPASRRQLEEIIRFKVRRSVPFRLEDAALSYQVLPGEGKSVTVLVALVRRGVVEQYERVMEGAGARVGLFDLCTPNLFNLCRAGLDGAARAGGDVALLNTTSTYFSLLIVRGERLIFYRCKTFTLGDAEPVGPNGALARELAASLSYYQGKLAGQGIEAMFVRSVAQPVQELGELVRRLGIVRVEVIDPAAALHLVPGLRLEPSVGQRIAPAVGAACGRGR